MSDKYGSTGMPARKDNMLKKNITSDLYMKNGVPCGDIEGIGESGKGPSGAGAGPKVGGYPMGIHNKFENGIPDEGRENISAEFMKPEHKENIKSSVLDTEEDPTWGGKIAPQNYGVHNTFGVK